MKGKIRGNKSNYFRFLINKIKYIGNYLSNLPASSQINESSTIDWIEIEGSNEHVKIPTWTSDINRNFQNK